MDGLQSLNHAAPCIPRRAGPKQGPSCPKASAGRQPPSVVQFGTENRSLVQTSLNTVKTALQDGPLMRYCSGSTERPIVQQFVADFAMSQIRLSVETPDLLFQTPNEATAAWCYRMPEQLPVAESIEPESHSDKKILIERIFNNGRRSFFQAHGPFIYLAWFGTLPTMQRKGFGGQVMKAITDVADAEKKWAYTEATAQGYHLYIQHGFEVLYKSQMSPDAPAMSHMGRPPQ